LNIYWITQTTEDLPEKLNWLHPSEMDVLTSFRFAKRKNDWLLGRWTAKKAVRAFLRNSHTDLSLEYIRIVSAADGAPEAFWQGDKLPVLISLSHTHRTAMCTIASPGIKLGCDIEKIEDRSELFIKDYFTKQEKSTITSLGKEKLPLWTNMVWSAKESALKALRTGLRIDTRKIDIEFFPGTIENKWYKLKGIYYEDQMRFYGYWQYQKDFVLSCLTNVSESKLIEISANGNLQR
jgi:4'-phosphopantetheinyl transferase